ncbi:uncharacterized protein RAG0_07624 [Rhynchosporium agropyri]|uniref:Uncharacterized protein n=1 Tax=Rhynchosporium agropyri TaxID=914238 RepID=A0A1E1KM92_9HELO|nr:uncharacterized protein RAG0_07624 [Rhynchosporium agropyri]
MPGDSKTVDGRSFVMDTLSVDPDLEYVYGRLSDNSRDLAILQYLDDDDDDNSHLRLGYLSQGLLGST